MNRKILLSLLCSVLLAPVTLTHAQTDTKPERVYLREIEGIWVNKAYADALRKQRMPHAVAKKIEPVVIAIRREGRSYPMVVTNFDKAAVQAVLELEPDKKPHSYRLVLAPDDKPISSDKVKYMYFRGMPNADGKYDKLQIAEIFFKKSQWADYVRVGDAIGPFVNSAVISGRYIDDQGRSWEFSDAGEAYWPGETFHYELSLNDKRAGCEYIEGEDLKAGDGKKRIGFVWKGDRLELFEAKMVKKHVRCDKKPFAVLTRQP